MDVRLFVMITVWWIGGGKARLKFGGNEEEKKETVRGCSWLETVPAYTAYSWETVSMPYIYIIYIPRLWGWKFGKNIWNINFNWQMDNLGAKVFGLRLNVYFYILENQFQRINSLKIRSLSPSSVIRLLAAFLLLVYFGSLPKFFTYNNRNYNRIIRLSKLVSLRCLYFTEMECLTII